MLKPSARSQQLHLKVTMEILILQLVIPSQMCSGQDLQDVIVSLVAKIISANFTTSKNGSFHAFESQVYCFYSGCY